MSYLSELESIAQKAAFRHSISTSEIDLLPYAVQALESVNGEGVVRFDVVQCLDRMLAYCPKEFIQLCAHYLAWPEFHKHFTDAHDDANRRGDWRKSLLYQDLLDALAPDWTTPDLFYANLFSRTEAQIEK
jgi:hypothetical protein